MMKYCVIHIKTLTASFRNPEFQNFHKSFTLPPPTTVIGLAGAALGLSPKKAQDFFDGKGFEIGIAGNSNGKAKDLWKYRTLDPSKPTSVLTREFLFDNNFYFAFGNEDEQLVDAIKNAFDAPHYALTLGNSDSIAKVVKTFITEQISKEKALKNCLLSGNAIEETLKKMSAGEAVDVFIEFRENMLYDLPTRFDYESDYGVRRINRREAFTFVGSKIILAVEQKCINIENHFLPVFPL
jgi:CRISPR-associated protein Cas5t